MPSKRFGFRLAAHVTAVVGVVVAAVAISSAGAQTSPAPGLVSATILSNNYRQGERSTVQYTFNEPVTLNGAPSSYLSKFELGSGGTNPVAASVEGNGFVVEADFLPSVDVGQFENASVAPGAVISTTGGVPNMVRSGDESAMVGAGPARSFVGHVASSAASVGLTITTTGATTGPDFRGADIPGDPTTASAPTTNQVIFYFDKPIETAVPGDFGVFLSGNSTPVMGTSIPAGGFTPGSTVVTIDFPVASTITAQSEFVLPGGVTNKAGLSNPEGVQGGNVSGVPGLLSAGSEWIASVTRASTQTYDFTFNQILAAATPSDFSLYTASDGRLTGSTATVSGQTVEVTFPTLSASSEVVDGAVVPGAVTSSSGVPSSAGQEPIGPSAGDFTATVAERGVGFTPTGPSITNNPATLRDAKCAPGDSPETGLQGQVPPAVRAAGFKGFNCNLSELAQYPAAGVTWAGGTWVGSWAGTCAYLSTQGHGVMVIDASNPADPKLVETINPPGFDLTTPGFEHTWESLKYNPARHLLAATSYQDPHFDVYNVSDCTHPVLDASIALGPNDAQHAGNWAPDGKTYYGTENYRGIGSVIAAIDTTDPTHPKLLENINLPAAGQGRPHDISFNPSGTIAYIQQPGQFGNNDFVTGQNGMVIMNTAQIQHRVPNPQTPVLGTLFWNNGGQGQQSVPVTYKGKSYVITTDETGSGGVGGRAGACARGLSPFGFASILNVNNPTAPFIVSKLRLGVDSPTACAIADDAPNTGSFGYDSHYCNVNRLNDPTMLACEYFEAGMRLFDISNPAKPSEIGYFNPPPGHGIDSQHATSSPVGFTETDWASSPPVFVGCNIWAQFQDNGYLFLKMTHGPAKRLCKADSSSADSSLQ